MRFVASWLLTLAVVCGVAFAQTTPQPRKLEGVQYYKVEYHRFKAGKADEGRAFIRKHYRPADRAAGIEVLEFTPVTGDWDWIAFFPVEADFLAWEGRQRRFGLERNSKRCPGVPKMQGNWTGNSATSSRNCASRSWRAT